MAKKIAKTNAVRLLSQAHIAHKLVCYEVDESNLAATHVAEQLGENVAQVFKTLVLKGDRTGHLVCVIPGDKELNLKLAAKVSGNKSVEMIPMKELLPTTGYIRGACSPIGMKKPFPTYIDASALMFSVIYVSAGIRGMQIEVNPSELISFVGATTVELIA
ncbi:MAG: Cys-tRNA(Pro) deacylase [Rikenellaceae bacterium]